MLHNLGEFGCDLRKVMKIVFCPKDGEPQSWDILSRNQLPGDGRTRASHVALAIRDSSHSRPPSPNKL